MMLIMIADVEGDPIEGAVIGVGLKALGKHIMFGYKMSGHRMQAHGQYGAHHQIKQRLPAKAIDDYKIEYKLYKNIDYLQFGRWLWIHNQWTKYIEKRLQANPHKFAGRTVEEFGFKKSGYIGVQQFITLISRGGRRRELN